MGEAGDNTAGLSGDRPIETADADQLGLASMATRLAKSISEQTAATGLVIGLEGKWGSGKSSLLNLTLSQLRRLDTEDGPAIVEFRPWLLGTRDALLSALFSDLATVIETSEAEKASTSEAALASAKRLAEGVRGFASSLGRYSSVASLAGLFVPGAHLVGEVLSRAGEAATDLGGSPPLSETKDKLSSALQNFGKKIVISIDDVDRLEPSEAIELLRLVKSVADFPNVIYLLCYDIEVLSDNVKSALGIADGAAYLEKIIQFSLHVPTPEVFDLRRWFSRELATLLPKVPNDTRKRLEVVIDNRGGRYLDTPRSVVRALNSLRVTLPAISDKVDIPDLVWLELIKLGNPALYRWIEGYCASTAATSLGRASVTEENKSTEFSKLQFILINDNVDFEQIGREFEDHLPGIGHDYSEDGGTIFEKYSISDRNNAVAGCRLSSPDHYRIYFALNIPKNAITSKDYDSYWLAADTSPEQISDLILSWLSLLQTNGASKAEAFLDRLHTTSKEVFSEIRARNTVMSLSSILDVVAERAGTGPFGSPIMWSQGDEILAQTLKRLGKPQRATLIKQLFGEGAAVCWLSDVFRDQLFAYGRTGDSARGEAIVTEQELDAIAALLTARYKTMTMTDILAAPRPTDLLYGWLQGGDAGEARRFVERNTREHGDLIQFLELLLGSVTSSSEGRVTTLSRRNVSSFVEYDAVKLRLARATKSKNADIASRAKILMEQVKAGESFE